MRPLLEFPRVSQASGSSQIVSVVTKSGHQNRQQHLSDNRPSPTGTYPFRLFPAIHGYPTGKPHLFDTSVRT